MLKGKNSKASNPFLKKKRNNHQENLDYWKEHIAEDPFYDGDGWLDDTTGIPFQPEYDYEHDELYPVKKSYSSSNHEFIKKVKKERRDQAMAIKSFNRKNRLPDLLGSPRAAQWGEKERYNLLNQQPEDYMEMAKTDPEAKTADFWIKLSKTLLTPKN